MLEVERELTRVRLDIERLDAEKTNIGRRVTYATIDVTISEERKAGLDGPLSLATRIRIAAADGLESALESVTVDRAVPPARRTDACCCGAWPPASCGSSAAGFCRASDLNGRKTTRDSRCGSRKPGCREAGSRKPEADYGFTETHGFGMNSCS